MLRLYDYLPSGNGYKVRLLLTLLAIPFERIELDIVEGETRTESFLAKNPNGRIPAVELENGEILSESGAILFYFGQGTDYFPDSPLDRARVLQWMFFEQYDHEPNIAVARHWIQHLGLDDERQRVLTERQRRGHEALGVMEQHLAQHAYFVSHRPTIADLALYAYTHVAEEGGFELDRFPAVGRWLSRIAALPGYIPITKA
ncbi:MAG: glutathione S-transferase family protein [Proteobacteria bacterium]|nr:glutathione S-transferase family protein [Pseudomonadota bacterium]